MADNIVASLRGEKLRPFRFKIIGLLATIGRRTGVAEILGMRFSGLLAWWLWRGIYLAKLPGFPKKVRVDARLAARSVLLEEHRAVADAAIDGRVATKHAAAGPQEAR